MNIPPEFMAMILAAPDDDAPRLITADWLEERGDAHRSEFIRVQCELAKVSTYDPENPGWLPSEREMTAHDGDTLRSLFKLNNWNRESKIDALRRRARELLETNSTGDTDIPYRYEWAYDDFRKPNDDRWWIRLINKRAVGEHGSLTGPFVFRWEFRRGFIERISIPAEDWLAHADAIIAATPLREVQLTSWPGKLQAAFHGSLFTPSTSVWFLSPEWTGTEDGEVDLESCQEALVQRILANRWPRIKFTLPSYPDYPQADFTLRMSGAGGEPDCDELVRSRP